MRAKVQTIKAPTVSDSATAVQLLTVHGAKGLQADVVILLGSDAQKRNAASMTTLIDWQPEDPAPKKFVFMQSESNPPNCAADLLAADIKARELEELNALYVAMTRAKQTLVLSASEAYTFNPKSVWNRLQSLCTPVPFAPDMPAKPYAARSAQVPLYASLTSINDLRTGQLTLPKMSTDLACDTNPVVQSDAAKRGSALHRLMQWQSTNSSSVAAVTREFALDETQAKLVQSQGQVMLTGEAAWLWDESIIDWQANEYELLQDGRMLRIDRLVRHRETGQWWVIDFKSSTAPEKSAALREQLSIYRAAIAKNMSVPLDQVQSAFVTAEGRLKVDPFVSSR
jgi:ATP-dependent helicase/nuclease subunit A